MSQSLDELREFPLGNYESAISTCYGHFLRITEKKKVTAQDVIPPNILKSLEEIFETALGKRNPSLQASARNHILENLSFSGVLLAHDVPDEIVNLTWQSIQVAATPLDSIEETLVVFEGTRDFLQRLAQAAASYEYNKLQAEAHEDMKI